MKRIDEIEDEIQNGMRLRFRNREQIESAKAKRLGKHTNTWFLDGQTVNTLRVMATPNSRLKNDLQKTLSSLGELADKGRTKVIELGGNPITKGMNKPEPFGGPGSCHMAGNGPECNTDKDHDCRSARVVYKAVCIHCETAGQETQYIGTSGRSLHSRTLEHMALINSRSNGNAKSRHHWAAHPNLNPNFRTQLIRGGIHFNV